MNKIRLVINPYKMSESMLVDNDGCRCVLGEYLHQLGVPDIQMKGVLVPSDLPELPEAAKWLLRDDGLDGDRETSIDACTIMEHVPNLIREDVEEAVAKIFAAHGVDFEVDRSAVLL